MTTNELLNADFKEKTDFYDALFRNKLKIAMEYRKLNQEQLAHLCNKHSQNAVSKWLTLNDRYKSVPNAPELMAITAVLQLSILFFTEPNMSCEEAETSLTPIEKMRLLKKKYDFFVETSVVNVCFTFLDKIRELSAVAVISTESNNGCSRTLEEYSALIEHTALFIGNRSVDYIENRIRQTILSGSELSEENKVLLIFDATEKIELALLKDIILYFNNKYNFPIAFIGKSIRPMFEGIGLSNLISNYYELNVLLLEDIRKFVKVMFPRKSETEIEYLVPLLVGGIHDIMDYYKIKRVKGNLK